LPERKVTRTMTALQYKSSLIKKHNKADWKVETSPMDEYDRYSKTYIFSDGFQITEVNEPVWEEVEIEYEVRGVKFTEKKSVKLFRTEIWSTETASVYFYEKY